MRRIISPVSWQAVHKAECHLLSLHTFNAFSCSSCSQSCMVRVWCAHTVIFKRPYDEKRLDVVWKEGRFFLRWGGRQKNFSQLGCFGGTAIAQFLHRLSSSTHQPPLAVPYPILRKKIPRQFVWNDQYYLVSSGDNWVVGVGVWPQRLLEECMVPPVYRLFAGLWYGLKKL